MSRIIENLHVIPDFFRRKLGKNDFINDALIGCTGKLGREKFASNILRLTMFLMLSVMVLGAVDYLVLQKLNLGVLGGHGRVPGRISLFGTIALSVLFDAFQAGVFVRRLRFLGRPVWEFLVPYVPLYIFNFVFKFKELVDSGFNPAASGLNHPGFVGMALSSIIFITYFYGIIYKGKTEVDGGTAVEDGDFRFWYPAWGMLFLGFTVGAMRV